MANGHCATINHTLSKAECVKALQGNIYRLHTDALGRTIGTSYMENRFLALPPELRTIIYRAVLVQREAVALAISEPSHPRNAQSGLLLACRQTRNEAIGIYYGENTFRLGIHSLRGKALVPIVRILMKYGEHDSKAPDVRLVHYGRPNWANLKEWLRNGHERRYWNMMAAMAEKCLQERDMKGKIMGSAFKMVVTMKEQPWEEVERLLELWHDMAKVVDAVWA